MAEVLAAIADGNAARPRRKPDSLETTPLLQCETCEAEKRHTYSRDAGFYNGVPVEQSDLPVRLEER